MNDFHKIHLTKVYKASPEKIFSLIADGTLFKLTGANLISFDFKTSGFFELQFTGRGVIKGNFAEIIPDKKIKLLWDVDGFGLEPESGTIVTIILHPEETGCTLELLHEKIKQNASACAKTRAWKEILNDLSKELNSKFEA